MSVLRLNTLLLAATLLAPTGALAVTTWNETVDGDLSDLPSAPTMLNFVAGENLVIAETHNATTGPDYFNVTLAPGAQIDAIVLNAYTGATALWWGIVDAPSLPATPGAADLITGGLTDGGELGTNILSSPDFGQPLLGGPIGPGDYLFWFNETGSADTWTLDFQVSVVPVPAALWLIGPALAILGVRSRKRQG